MSFFEQIKAVQKKYLLKITEVKKKQLVPAENNIVNNPLRFRAKSSAVKIEKIVKHTSRKMVVGYSIRLNWGHLIYLRRNLLNNLYAFYQMLITRKRNVLNAAKLHMIVSTLMKTFNYFQFSCLLRNFPCAISFTSTSIILLLEKTVDIFAKITHFASAVF